ncbi:SIR2 family protein [Verminephrobacter aporrectodeae subsp. tuberculatae]|nr:SIR2 family protein [Verminephrobacter aporrectodeae subsp. tuberculatae]MCW8201479.1 SIR2 family protein [Verminephrobacter aporrectodeae subsp. tuberculatae]
MVVGGVQHGIDTMAPLAKEFLGGGDDPCFPSKEERSVLRKYLGFDLAEAEFASNLERLMEVLYSFQFVLKQSSSEEMEKGQPAVKSLIEKVTAFVTKKCSDTPFSQEGDSAIVNLYQAFYRKLVYRDRTLPRPWIFTTNYDLLSEIALDRLGMPYCNGFSGTIERRFNPATYRYALAEQLDLTSRKWAAVDSFVYLCKLHGSINWIEKGGSLFPIREISAGATPNGRRVMIYPTPMKQNASFGSPYSDLFREFQGRIVRDQSVLFVLGYSFGDEHVNNLIFQALTVPTFRLVAFLPPETAGVVQKLRDLRDPRIWLIGGAGPKADAKAHYFDTFVGRFMPESPGDKVDTAVKEVVKLLIAHGVRGEPNGGNGHDD